MPYWPRVSSKRQPPIAYAGLPPFKEISDSEVYLSTKNLNLSKNCARKLSPKFIDPYRILKSFHNDTFQLDLPSELRRRGIHANFHASLLRTKEDSDDSLFPGRTLGQLTGLGDDTEE